MFKAKLLREIKIPEVLETLEGRNVRVFKTEENNLCDNTVIMRGLVDDANNTIYVLDIQVITQNERNN